MGLLLAWQEKPQDRLGREGAAARPREAGENSMKGSFAMSETLHVVLGPERPRARLAHASDAGLSR